MSPTFVLPWARLYLHLWQGALACTRRAVLEADLNLALMEARR